MRSHDLLIHEEHFLALLSQAALQAGAWQWPAMAPLHAAGDTKSRQQLSVYHVQCLLQSFVLQCCLRPCEKAHVKAMPSDQWTCV